VASAWGSATKDGRLIGIDTLDTPDVAHAVVIVAFPDRGNAYICGTDAGEIGDHFLMNNKGLFLGNSGGGGSPRPEDEGYGLCWALSLPYLVRFCDGAIEARDMVTKWQINVPENFHFVDVRGNAFVVEKTAAIQAVLPGIEVRHVLTRGGWHRLGGVVDLEGRRISRHIAEWAEQEAQGKIEDLLFKLSTARCFATRLNGQAHYLVAQAGPGAADYIQIEVEQVQEVLDRCITDPDWFPDSIAEFVDPLAFPRLEPGPVGPPRLLFRRLVQVGDLLAASDASQQVRRFLEDWDRSSAGEAACFSDHWVLSLREYRDRDGEGRLTAKPVSTFAGIIPSVPSDLAVRGAELANLIHGLDRQIGYPFAWFFHMLTDKHISHHLPEAVHADLMGAYAYLAARDLKVLRDWYDQPYGV